MTGPADDLAAADPTGGPYEPCPTCGQPSLAQIVDHSCEECADTSIYCPDCSAERARGQV